VLVINSGAVDNVTGTIEVSGSAAGFKVDVLLEKLHKSYFKNSSKMSVRLLSGFLILFLFAHKVAWFLTGRRLEAYFIETGTSTKVGW
jgi:hypothetical protein